MHRLPLKTSAALSMLLVLIGPVWAGNSLEVAAPEGCRLAHQENSAHCYWTTTSGRNRAIIYQRNVFDFDDMYRNPEAKSNAKSAPDFFWISKAYQAMNDITNNAKKQGIFEIERSSAAVLAKNERPSETDVCLREERQFRELAAAAKEKRQKSLSLLCLSYDHESDLVALDYLVFVEEYPLDGKPLENFRSTAMRILSSAVFHQ